MPASTARRPPGRSALPRCSTRCRCASVRDTCSTSSRSSSCGCANHAGCAARSQRGMSAWSAAATAAAWSAAANAAGWSAIASRISRSHSSHDVRAPLQVEQRRQPRAVPQRVLEVRIAVDQPATDVVERAPPLADHRRDLGEQAGIAALRDHRVDQREQRRERERVRRLELERIELPDLRRMYRAERLGELGDRPLPLCAAHRAPRTGTGQAEELLEEAVQRIRPAVIDRGARRETRAARPDGRSASRTS